MLWHLKYSKLWSGVLHREMTRDKKGFTREVRQTFQNSQ